MQFNLLVRKQKNPVQVLQKLLTILNERKKLKKNLNQLDKMVHGVFLRQQSLVFKSTDYYIVDWDP